MFLVSVIIFVVIILTALEDREIMRNGMLLGFIILIVFFSLRYKYGNDYTSYNAIYLKIVECDSIEQALIKNDIEGGWVLFNYFLKPFGFQSVIFLTTLIGNALIYKIIRLFVPTGWYWLAVFWYLVNPDLFLLNLSMLRQGMAEILMLFAIGLACKKKYVIPSILSFIALCIHNSSIIIFPFLLFAFISEKINIKYIIYLILFLCALMLYDESIVTASFEYIMEMNVENEEFRKYISEEDTGMKVGIGVILQIVAGLPVFFNLRNFNVYIKYFFLLYIVSFVFIPFASFSVMFLRLRGFFIIFGIMLFPMFLNQVTNSPLIKKMALSSIIIYSIYSYFAFFSSSTYGVAYSTYNFVGI